jgi:hypothetical protein
MPAAMMLRRLYRSAIRDNAQDDSQPIPLELVGSFQVDCDAIINALSEAAAQGNSPAHSPTCPMPSAPYPAL